MATELEPIGYDGYGSPLFAWQVGPETCESAPPPDAQPSTRNVKADTAQPTEQSTTSAEGQPTRAATTPHTPSSEPHGRRE